VERLAPQQVILFGSLARGETRRDSDADLLVVMPFEGPTRETVQQMLTSCTPDCPLDLHLRRPDELNPRYQWGYSYLCAALDHGERLHGQALHGLSGDGIPKHWPCGTASDPAIHSEPARNPVVDKWVARAERHWRLAELLPDLPPGYLCGVFQVQRCLETYLRAALIAQGVPCRKCRDLLTLSDRLRVPIPGWQADAETLNSLSAAALAYLDPGAGDPEPSHQDTTRALAEASPLRDGLRRWFATLPAARLVQKQGSPPSADCTRPCR